ncbi:hypothetical protein [Actinoplanes sp. NPDC051851]|uniref:hypothetical protein n=1 Tax=Actinoplanes sp. NPDC051851 TaxID=3154753 RepID=UPI003430A65F
MRTSRLAGVGIAAVLTVAGCTANGTGGASPSASAGAGPSGTASSSADPAAVKALTDAADKLDDTTVKLTVTSGSGFQLTALTDAPHGTGTADLVAQSANAKLTVKSLLVGEDLYAQIPGITTADKWTHLDMARLPEDASVGLRPGQIDPVNTAKLLSSATDVHQSGEAEYAGTLDLSDAAGVAGLGQVTIDGSSVPFSAALDNEGRLEILTIQQEQPVVAKYSGYGTPVTVTAPAASEVVEAPDSVYQALGGR